jgi:hypothetical protein
MNKKTYKRIFIPDFINIPLINGSDIKQYKLMYNDKNILIKEESLKNIFNKCYNYKFLDFSRYDTKIKNYKDFIDFFKDFYGRKIEYEYIDVDTFLLMLQEIIYDFKSISGLSIEQLNINQLRSFIDIRTRLIIFYNNVFNFKKEWKKKIQKKRLEAASAILIRASAHGYIEKVKESLKAGADVNSKTEYGSTALIIASEYGHTEIVKLLLEAGADVNAKNNDECTALIYASERSNIEIVKLLLEAGADINAKNVFGYTALMRALYNGHEEIAKMLSEAGADVKDRRLR